MSEIIRRFRDVAVTDARPQARLTARSVVSDHIGAVPMQTTYTWEPVDGGTRMTLRNQGDPTGFAKITEPLMERAMRRATTKDLSRLKALLEGCHLTLSQCQGS